ncbi:MAG: hypothetical protein AAF696_30305 [Bacteroidota bacterium]
MRIALLNKEPLIAEWFAKSYPEVSLCCEVNEAFWEAECMLIMSFYDLQEGHYQVLNLWEKFLRIRHKRKKLVVLGWSPAAVSNYLQVGNMPAELSMDWLRKIRKAGAGEEKPSYPKLPDKEILKDIGKFLHSHGERPFQKLLSKVQAPLRVVERAIREGNHRESIEKMKEMQEAMYLMNMAKTAWEYRKEYYSLMPQYLELKKFEDLWLLWEEVNAQYKLPSPKLSQQLGSYIQDVIVDIVRFYGIEQKS